MPQADSPSLLNIIMPCIFKIIRSSVMSQYFRSVLFKRAAIIYTFRAYICVARSKSPIHKYEKAKKKEG
jgi:hypothetical protein